MAMQSSAYVVPPVGPSYAPPGVYTQTLFENPIAATLTALQIPVFVGEGNEDLLQSSLEIVRGSSATMDIQVVGEDETGQAVAQRNNAGQVIALGAWDGTRDTFQVHNYPIVTGDGTHTTTNLRTSVSVTINQQPVVVRAVNGTLGTVQLATIPQPGDLVQCTYWFDRDDTQITDDVSAQVPAVNATITGIFGQPFGGVPFVFNNDIVINGNLVNPANNVLLLMVNGTAKTGPEIEDWSDDQEADSLMKNPEKRDYFVAACQKLGLKPEKTTTFDWLEADDRASFPSAGK